ncbi:hypothetical protein [Xanthomonas phage pXoo2107]|nr:hypothetical protein [Xanthomonas phage pXoo2107]
MNNQVLAIQILELYLSDDELLEDMAPNDVYNAAVFAIRDLLAGKYIDLRNLHDQA